MEKHTHTHTHQENGTGGRGNGTRPESNGKRKTKQKKWTEQVKGEETAMRLIAFARRILRRLRETDPDQMSKENAPSSPHDKDTTAPSEECAAQSTPEDVRRNMDMWENLTSITSLSHMGMGGLLGFCSGYAVRRLGGELVLVAGIGVVSVQLLSYAGLLTVHWDKIREWTGPVDEQRIRGYWQRFRHVVGHNLPFGASFGAGMLMGLRPYLL